MAEEIEIPEYFLCPISLQIMKDPVTTLTGITYDRDSIEQWLRTAKDKTCPVTKQPLQSGNDLLTPNHMLHRYIQAWCVANSKTVGIDQTLSPINKSILIELVQSLGNGNLEINALKKMEELAKEDERNRKFMAELGAIKGVILYIVKSFKGSMTIGLEDALRILQLIWTTSNENKQLVHEYHDLLIRSLTWILTRDMQNSVAIKTEAAVVLRLITQISSTSTLERLKLDFFKAMVNILRANISHKVIKSMLHVLIQVCPLGRNKIKIVEANGVFELIELELGNQEKKISELVFCLLAMLCACADGRAQMLKHVGGIAVVAKRILRVSPTTDDRAIKIFTMIAGFLARKEVLMEMLRVGAVSKLCMVIQADCAPYVKKRAREILRLHSSVWSNSPCIQIYLLTRYPR